MANGKSCPIQPRETLIKEKITKTASNHEIGKML
jgi:hypothetical protein